MRFGDEKNGKCAEVRVKRRIAKGLNKENKVKLRQ